MQAPLLIDRKVCSEQSSLPTPIPTKIYYLCHRERLSFAQLVEIAAVALRLPFRLR